MAMVDDTVIDSHPEIKSAVATLRQRYLDNSRSTIVAPVSGYVAKRAVQLGMRVDSGTTLMAIVPLNEVWVDANFKESQMKGMRLGQKVTLSADLYGDDVEYHGTIEAWALAPVALSRCCRHRTPAVTGSKLSSVCRSVSCSIPMICRKPAARRPVDER
jgi:multidrug resistance efflux pump